MHTPHSTQHAPARALCPKVERDESQRGPEPCSARSASQNGSQTEEMSQKAQKEREMPPTEERPERLNEGFWRQKPAESLGERKSARNLCAALIDRCGSVSSSLCRLAQQAQKANNSRSCTGDRVFRDTRSEWRLGSAGNSAENEGKNKGSREARQKANGFARNPRNRVPSDLSQSVPKGTLHPRTRPARDAGPEQGRCLAVTLKEHGQANTWSCEGSQEPQESVGCAGCRAPPCRSRPLGTHQHT